MLVYEDLIKQVPEFNEYDILGSENYLDIGISPLGTVGEWLNELCQQPKENEPLISRICNFLNYIYTNAALFRDDVLNDICVYLFWRLEYPTIRLIKPYLLTGIITDGREYLKVMDGDNYQEF